MNVIKSPITYLDIALPTALPKVLTYRWVKDENPPAVGMRVVVPLGNRRLTGVVWATHKNEPAGYNPKDIEAVIDDRPVVTQAQTQCWSWMSNYYMCPLGDVVNTAMPSGMKLTSKTRILINPDGDLGIELRDTPLQLLDALKSRGGMDVKEIAEVLNLKYPQRIIRTLIDKGLAISEEELKEKYKQKKKAFVTLHPELQDDEEALKAELDFLEKKAPAQAKLLLKLLELSPTFAPTPKVALQKQAGVTSAITNKLIENKLVEIEHKAVDRIIEFSGEIEPLPTLTKAQTQARDQIQASLFELKPALLYGVTGSGKTEIYVHLISEALKAEKQVLFLVPEIALTTQLIGRLQRFFGPKVSVYHSKFNSSERTETWLKILDDEGGSLVVGARSALFMPFRNLGLIIVDEEHEPSYKQQDPSPRYHARDVALWMSVKMRVPCVLGSATPSVEAVWASKQGKMTKVDLMERYSGVMMPEVLVADLKKEHKQRSMRGGFSKLLRDQMEIVLEDKRQIILFQNRRGYAPSWQCDACGDTVMCERCDIPLTLHKHLKGLHCHHCGYHITPTPSKCGACGSHSVNAKGLGTERIEEELVELFPSARVGRMDRDTTRSKYAHAKLLEDFSNKEYDILVGTQMVSKGLDFKDVALVGVMSADKMFTFPDFRSFERAYQMLTQVAGRAGRSTERGKVVVQTFSPEHWVIQRVIAGDHDKLVSNELIERKSYLYPPYVRLIRISLRHSDQKRVKAGADVLSKRLRQRFGERVVGPDTPYLTRVNDLFRLEILLKFERELSPSNYKPVLAQDIDEFVTDPRFKRLRLKLDVDPV
ncbi:MAG: primosomal protein N' [Bacteroidota bacterium]|nr:primosomal protein N' [Bacteroidota bacterium]